MVTVSGDKSATGQKGPQKTSGEARPNKVTKRTKERKQTKSLDADAVMEAAGTSPESEDTQESRDKRSQGIVIDGRTYTCATCKTGHRVGICKHARERPMTATHPPGRPSAGAPKKVICDCPKQCSCKKRGCKCARKCSCTQMMYMLVYVPAPGEENYDEEKGAWKLGQPVTTDLKGNILTPEQVRERREQKEAQKTQVPEPRRTSMPQSNQVEAKTNTPPASEAKPKELGGCCKHKENVATRNIAAETLPQSGKISRSSTDGCNCGSACSCAFCPQHPNNTTSQNMAKDMARQEAVHFANQPYSHEYQSIVPLMSSVSQGASCMGGLPQFAISRYSEIPSYNDLQRAFPNPGYVIGYPIWSTRNDSAGFPVASFATQSQFGSEISMIPSDGLNDIQAPFSAPRIASTSQQLPTLGYSQDEFGIGNAFVASAGTGTWDPQFISPSPWSMDTTVQTPIVEGFMDRPDFIGQSTTHSELPPFTPAPNTPGFDFSNHLNVPGVNQLHNLVVPGGESNLEAGYATVTQKSCCGTPYEGSTFLGNQPMPQNYFCSVEDDTLAIERQTSV